MTNEEKLKSKSADALAGDLAALTWFESAYGWPYYRGPQGEPLHSFGAAESAWLKWLKEEAK